MTANSGDESRGGGWVGDPALIQADVGGSVAPATGSGEASAGILISRPNAAATLSPLAGWGRVLMESGDTQTVSLWLVPGVMVGDRLLVEDGVAIADFGPLPDEPEEPDGSEELEDDGWPYNVA